MDGPGESRVAIFAAPSTGLVGRSISMMCGSRRSERSAAAEGNGEMRKVGLLLRSAPSRIGRRLALIAAIAAASLPSAGV
jgi:hypothetical protein